ncbi:hypothetical protein, partial [Pseudomonas putida]|uniref:hypothetical protein n=1 Tax=Pseudomonas putida TaxID=303 RepID=UPI003463FBE6
MFFKNWLFTAEAYVSVDARGANFCELSSQFSTCQICIHSTCPDCCYRKHNLPYSFLDATYKSKYLWWNTLAQVERYQDCSGKSTYYRYDERQHLVAV